MSPQKRTRINFETRKHGKGHHLPALKQNLLFERSYYKLLSMDKRDLSFSLFTRSKLLRIMRKFCANLALKYYPRPNLDVDWHSSRCQLSVDTCNFLTKLKTPRSTNQWRYRFPIHRFSNLIYNMNEIFIKKYRVVCFESILIAERSLPSDHARGTCSRNSASIYVFGFNANICVSTSS